MYTATRKSDVTNKQIRRRVVTVTFTDGAETFDQDFQFAISTPVETIKDTVQRFLDEINATAPELTGDIAEAKTVVEPTPPTADEIARTEWDVDVAKLQRIQELIDIGVLDGTETAVVNLRNKAKTNLKASYIA
jgi:hypothetical protein